jgi:hypothetical protein
MSKPPFVLLINPWIVDFAAFDFWSKPLGLLYLAALLREGGAGVHLIDCLDRNDRETLERPDVLPGNEKRFGTGKFPRMRIPKPPPVAGMPRNFHRYGIHPESFRKKLADLEKPDMVWVTSVMTYWYPGVREAIRIVKDVFSETPLWLGGIYAALCPEHAGRTSGADFVCSAPPGELPQRLETAAGFRPLNAERWGTFVDWPRPALDLLPGTRFAPLMSSTGCAYQCPYCASPKLQPRWSRRPAEAVYDEIASRYRDSGVRDFAFYDDALLIGAETTLRPALEKVAAEGPSVRFHTPNALHVRALTRSWCELLRASGFRTLRLGLETTHARHQADWGGKVEMESFYRAVENLRGAGFDRRETGVYLLCGLPGQSPEEVAEAVETVHGAGAQPFLAEYSPIPHTPMWPEALRVSPFDLASEPLYHNNTFFACRRPDFTLHDLKLLKDLARDRRNAR